MDFKIILLSSIIFSVMIVGCGIQKGTTVSYSDPEIQRFVDSFNLSEPHGITTYLSVPEENLTVFKIRYGKAMDCPSGCIFSSATGIKYKDKIGWISLEEYSGLQDINNSYYYDFDSKDTYLFSEDFLTKFKNTWDGWIYSYKYVPLLLKNKDTPLETLFFIYKDYIQYIKSFNNLSILDNTSINTYKDFIFIIRNNLRPSSGEYYHHRTNLLEKNYSEFDKFIINRSSNILKNEGINTNKIDYPRYFIYYPIRFINNSFKIKLELEDYSNHCKHRLQISLEGEDEYYGCIKLKKLYSKISTTGVIKTIYEKDYNLYGINYTIEIFPSEMEICDPLITVYIYKLNPEGDKVTIINTTDGWYTSYTPEWELIHQPILQPNIGCISNEYVNITRTWFADEEGNYQFWGLIDKLGIANKANTTVTIKQDKLSPLDMFLI